MTYYQSYATSPTNKSQNFPIYGDKSINHHRLSLENSKSFQKSQLPPKNVLCRGMIAPLQVWCCYCCCYYATNLIRIVELLHLFIGHVDTECEIPPALSKAKAWTIAAIAMKHKPRRWVSLPYINFSILLECLLLHRLTLTMFIERRHAFHGIILL